MIIKYSSSLYIYSKDSSEKAYPKISLFQKIPQNVRDSIIIVDYNNFEHLESLA